MKLQYQNIKLEDGDKTVSFGIMVKNGDVHDFAKFGERQKHFEQKALATKEWVRVDETTGEAVEDAEIVDGDD
jgi:hypothetical protein